MSEQVDSASPVKAAVSAVLQMRTTERLLASAGFYQEAAAIRQQRERVEGCSVSSVEDMRPDHGEYSPQTIGQKADQAAKGGA